MAGLWRKGWGEHGKELASHAWRVTVGWGMLLCNDRALTRSGISGGVAGNAYACIVTRKQVRCRLRNTGT